MQWREEAIVIGTRKHGETSVIVEVMTRDHGRHLGLVRGGRSRAMRPVLQPGNRVDVTWRARLDEHLGTFAVEPLALAAARLMESRAAVSGLQLLAAHLRLLPERDPHPALFEAAEIVVSHLGDPAIAGPLMVRFELRLLEELGFGLDLSRCAGSGVRDELIYVSPKSGQAVSRAAGEPWKDKLLPLPAFLTKGGIGAGGDVADAFRLTGYFLQRDVWQSRGIDQPVTRDAFVKAVSEAMAATG